MAAATLPLPHADSTAADPTVNFSQARFAFRQLETWLTAAEATTASEAQVEEQLEQRGRELLRLLLQAHLRQRGTGQVGPALRVFAPPAANAASDDAGASPPEGLRHGEKRLHERTLHTILGEVTVERIGYAASGAASVHPLDEQLQLPQRCFTSPWPKRLRRPSAQGTLPHAV